MNVGRHSRSSSSFTRLRPWNSARAITPGRFASFFASGINVKTVRRNYRVKQIVHGIAHITGGGLIDNPPRILP